MSTRLDLPNFQMNHRCQLDKEVLDHAYCQEVRDNLLLLRAGIMMNLIGKFPNQKLNKDNFLGILCNRLRNSCQFSHCKFQVDRALDIQILGDNMLL